MASKTPAKSPAQKSAQTPATAPAEAAPAPDAAPAKPQTAARAAPAPEPVFAYFLKTRVVAEATCARGRVAPLAEGVFKTLKAEGAVRQATPDERKLAGV